LPVKLSEALLSALKPQIPTTPTGMNKLPSQLGDSMKSVLRSQPTMLSDAIKKSELIAPSVARATGLGAAAFGTGAILGASLSGASTGTAVLTGLQAGLALPVAGVVGLSVIQAYKKYKELHPDEDIVIADNKELFTECYNLSTNDMKKNVTDGKIRILGKTNDKCIYYNDDENTIITNPMVTP
jgi:hypothetical protein